MDYAQSLTVSRVTIIVMLCLALSPLLFLLQDGQGWEFIICGIFMIITLPSILILLVACRKLFSKNHQPGRPLQYTIRMLGLSIIVSGLVALLLFNTT